jgi:tRNA (cmo5U34)-methyltransferase
MPQDERDRLFGAADHPDAPLVLDDRVARVFSEMVRRSVPGYADLHDVAIADASLAVLNLTLLFILPERRLALLTRVRAGLRPGGALILAEKVRGADDLHHGFKPAMGYSRLEIARKRAALERVLVPDTVAVHEQRPREAGFSHQLRWFQCLNFAAWLA